MLEPIATLAAGVNQWPYSRFWRTVRCGNRRPSWNT